MVYVTQRQRKAKRIRRLKTILASVCGVGVIGTGAYLAVNQLNLPGITSSSKSSSQSVYLNEDNSLSKVDWSNISIPDYSAVNKPYVEINSNVPFFTTEDLAEYGNKAYEYYSELDSLGRCGYAFASVCKETMPVDGEERGEIGSVRPSGWAQAKYEGLVDSNPPYLYNRCHLIAWCLTSENANEKNLITGTRYFNVEGMLGFEEKVAKYLSSNPGNHVLYRSTPLFEGNNLLASGVLIEAYSVEDNGKGISFCVYCYNVQPGVEINYSNGESKVSS